MVTFNTRQAAEDWCGVRRSQPAPGRRALFAHGHVFHTPATSATDKGLKDGQPFTLRLREAVQAVAVRVIGKPAHGDNSAQAFKPCAELQAFAD